MKNESKDTKCDASDIPGVVFDPNKVIHVSNDPRIYAYEGFLTPEECDHFIQMGNAVGLERSQVAATESNSKSEARTSYGNFLNTGDDPILKRVEERISLWSQLPVSNMEPFYLLRYQIGQEYKAHFDYFDPTIRGMDRYIGKAGQRTCTIVMYLHTPEGGGETAFPTAGLMVPAVRTTAVMFWSHTVDHVLDPHSIHGSLPVTEGTKYCVTKWIRENRYG